MAESNRLGRRSQPTSAIGGRPAPPGTIARRARPPLAHRWGWTESNRPVRTVCQPPPPARRPNAQGHVRIAPAAYHRCSRACFVASMLRLSSASSCWHLAEGQTKVFLSLGVNNRRQNLQTLRTVALMNCGSSTAHVPLLPACLALPPPCSIVPKHLGPRRLVQEPTPQPSDHRGASIAVLLTWRHPGLLQEYFPPPVNVFTGRAGAPHRSQVIPHRASVQLVFLSCWFCVGRDALPPDEMHPRHWSAPSAAFLCSQVLQTFINAASGAGRYPGKR